MKTIEDAEKLAKMMVAIGKLSGRKVIGVLSDMNQPLGEAVGNALELKEALAALNGYGPSDFVEHCLVISSYMLVLGKKVANLEEAREKADIALESGQAFEKFRQLVIAQKGDVSFIDNPQKLPSAPFTMEVKAPQSGWLAEVRAQTVGETAVDLGAGRAKKEDVIDQGVGILVRCKVGDKVAQGSPLFTIHARSQAEAEAAQARLLGALKWSPVAVEPLPLFYGVIGEI